MSAISENSALAPFSVRSFRFQWPADLATSWAFEMENLILAWYVLVESRSVVMFTVFVSLQYIGTLFAPMFGVMGDRIGHRNMLCGMRGLYTVLAATLMTLIATGTLTPVLVMVIAAMMGMVRPSDVGMRYALIGATIPGGYLVGATSIQRTTQDSARVAGALSGAGLVAALGMGWTYAVVATLYLTSLVLVFKAGSERASSRTATEPAPNANAGSAWRDLVEGAVYIWNTPVLLATMVLAFLVNAMAFPQFVALLPVVAKEVHHGGQPLLGAFVASGAFGSLVGSVVMSKIGSAFRPGRMMLVWCSMWYVALFVFAQMSSTVIGMFVLFFGGICQSAGLVPMYAILMRDTNPQFRGRVMGARVMAIYGNLPGLLIAGPLIANVGYQATASLYCVLGLLTTLLIGAIWRGDLWRISAPTNRR